MTDFVIVAVTAATMLAPSSFGPTPPLVVVAQPPTVGFHAYSGIGVCEKAVAKLTTPAGRRLACVPAEALNGELARAY